jgi:V8-like Glu-specific endopeptidase
LLIFSALVVPMLFATGATGTAAARPTVSSGTTATSTAGTTASTAGTTGIAGGTSRVTRAAGTTADPTRYWSPTRLAAATPLDETATPATGSSRGGLSPLPRPGPVVRHATGVAAPGEAARRAVQLNESITVGKIFFTNSTTGADNYCSASVVNSVARNMVLTAAHCLHDGPGRRWHTANWIFVPSYRDGARPYGTWNWSTLAVPTGWINTRERQYDVGVALVHGSRSVVDAVGANGLLTGGGRSYRYDIFGYPSNRGGGEAQWVCSGTSSDAGSNRIEMGCPWGGGSSGGPWYFRYDDTTRVGDVHGVTSYTNDRDNPTYIGSPHFSDAVVGTLYRTYASRTW